MFWCTTWLLENYKEFLKSVCRFEFSTKKSIEQHTWFSQNTKISQKQSLKRWHRTLNFGYSGHICSLWPKTTNMLVFFLLHNFNCSRLVGRIVTIFTNMWKTREYLMRGKLTINWECVNHFMQKAVFLKYFLVITCPMPLLQICGPYSL